LVGKVAVVSAILPRMLPESLGGIEFGRIGRKLMHLQPVAIGFEPSPHLRVLMIGGIVLNQDRSATAIMPSQLLEEGLVGGGVEDCVLLVMESSVPEFNGAQDLDALAFSGDGDLGRMADPAPGGVQRGILPEAGFVGENQRPVLPLGFFLRRG